MVKSHPAPFVPPIFPRIAICPVSGPRTHFHLTRLRPTHRRSAFLPVPPPTAPGSFMWWTIMQMTLAVSLVAGLLRLRLPHSKAQDRSLFQTLGLLILTHHKSR